MEVSRFHLITSTEALTLILARFHRSMTRIFFTRDKISHFDIFDRHTDDVVKQMKARMRAGYSVDFQVNSKAS